MVEKLVLPVSFCIKKCETSFESSSWWGTSGGARRSSAKYFPESLGKQQQAPTKDVYGLLADNMTFTFTLVSS